MVNEKMKRHLGRFKVCEYLIVSEPKSVMGLMSKIIVIRCDQVQNCAQYEYTAISEELFRCLKEGEKIPEYEITIEVKPDNKGFDVKAIELKAV